MQGTKTRPLAGGLLMAATVDYVQANTLQPDPAWQQGTLSNGLRWQVLIALQRPNDRVEVRLLVNTGSLVEGTQQSGYSHTIPRITPMQSDGLDIAQACSLWQQGINPKRPTPPVTISHDTTLSNLSLSSNRSDLLREALSYLVNATNKLTIVPETISHALQSQGMVATWSVDTKEGWWRCRLERSTLLGHDPADPLKQPTEVEKIKDLHQRWYTSDAMMLLVVGNMDVRSAVDRVNKTFGELKGKRETSALVPTLSPLRTEAVSIITNVMCQDRLSIMWNTPWQSIRKSAALLRYWRADLAHEALFWHVQQALSASSSRDIGLEFDCRVLYLRAQCVTDAESSNDKLNSDLNLVARELVKVRNKGLPGGEFNALVAQKEPELQELFAVYTRADTDILMGQRTRSSQNQAVDIASGQYQKLHQDFLNNLTVEVLNQDLHQQLSNDTALILLQPKGKSGFNMRALQAAWGQIMAPSTAAAAASVATDDVHPEVTNIPPVQ